ncbi:acyltransferase family protein [Flavobacterium lacustre]|uniref:acyltransferase family protein n=1 Tax=Flavobacterium lacustre TaxID=3016339 RepID=UPI0022B6579D|nr:acyltransferase [Flavobacterium lacustre]
MVQDRIYLPGLNRLRAIAALCVILAHLSEQLVEKGLFKRNYFGHFGGYSVTIFFTLSGFLITYLLLKEIEFQSKIDVKKFYIRRILRIWPLYFLFIFLIAIVMNFKMPNTIWYYIFILPNIPFAIHLSGKALTTIPLLIHYWSLGVEEQFYAFWPWLIKFSSKIKRTIIIFCVAYFGLKICLSILHAPIVWQSILLHTRFCCLGIGGVGACVYFENNSILAFIKNRIVEFSAWLLVILFLMNQIRVFSIVNNEIISILVVILIINQIYNPKTIIYLENRCFDYLGKISYGLYIYNPLIIYFLNFYLFDVNCKNVYIKSMLIIVTTFSLVILVSHISYFYFEKHFLKIKHRFATVESCSSKLNPLEIQRA